MGLEVTVWFAECSLASLSHVGVNAISHLSTVARKRPTPVLRLLSLAQASPGSDISGG